MPTSSIRNKLEDGIELNLARPQVQRSISARMVRFNEDITAKSEHVYSDEGDYSFPHGVIKEPLPTEEEKHIQGPESGTKVDPIYEPTGPRGKLTIEMKKQFDRISPVICRTGYEYLSHPSSRSAYPDRYCDSGRDPSSARKDRVGKSFCFQDRKQQVSHDQSL
ncbi:hypothetical protein P879_02342 [Paragonimus westermani]|uniref:Uncharacterized protein n=1 Tax=Paragonimus westermani TaxID=34504 RepID=A0A8T0DUJ3_9TREM|nr:hypothetical protein P879_02342 [Paragonimus westermani]